MTTQLRDELARLGDDAPALLVDTGTWKRGRRARRRDRVTVTAAVLVLVASVGGAALALTVDPTTEDLAAVAPAGDPAAAGVPDQVSLPPAHLLETGDGRARWDGRVLESDLAVGRGAVAFEAIGDDLEGRALPMVVTADGAHHALDLPGWQGTDPDVVMPDGTRLLAVSPDGTRLAYAWRSDTDTGSDTAAAAGTDPATTTDPDSDPDGHGVRVLDLTTGDVRSVPFTDDVADVVGHVGWSPDSRWLLWCGAQVTATSENSSAYDLVCGRIAPEGEETETFSWFFGAQAISSDGVVTQTEGYRTRTWDGRAAPWQRRATRAVNLTHAASHSPSGTTVLLGSTEGRQGARFLDAATGELTERPLGKGLGLYPEGAELHPLGWVDDSLAVALVMPHGNVTVPDDTQLVMMTAPSVPEESWTYRIVGHVDTSAASGFAPSSLSVAVDLMSPDRPTVAVERPDWPADTERRVGWAVGLVTVGGLAAAYLLTRRRRRVP